MMKLMWGGIIFLATTAMMAQAPSQNTNVDQLRDLAANAKSSGDLLAEANYLCQAATVDNKYEKKCSKAKEEADKTIIEFQTNLKSGRKEIVQKNYIDAIRELDKITFGPNKIEAKELIQLLRIASTGGAAVDLKSYDAFNFARAAYSHGDFEMALFEAKLVQSAPLQDATSKLVTNITIYRDVMKQADAMTRSGDLKGAEQKYRFAALIKPDGPGQPQDRLREVQIAEAQAANTKSDTQSQSVVPGPSQAASTATSPAQASSDQDKSSKVQGSKNQSSVKNARQPPKVAPEIARTSGNTFGDKAASGSFKQDPQEVEDNLTRGVEDFYLSRFLDADDAIEAYLRSGGAQYAGAAHFFLGASLFAQSLLTSPKDKLLAESLEDKARVQFTTARKLNYRPVETAISPKVFGEWVKIGSQQ